MSLNASNFLIDDLSEYPRINHLKGTDRFQDFGSMRLFDTHKHLVWNNPTGSSRPLFTWYANNRLPVSQIKHSPEQVKEINRRGVTFICYEPLCLYNATDLYHNQHNCHNFGFYSEFSHSNVSYRSSELDSIKDYVVNNGIDPEKVFVITCDYDADKHLSYYNDYMQLIFVDVFLQNLEYYDNICNQPPKDMQKRFILTSWRYTSARAAVSAIVPLHDTFLSWHYDIEYDFVHDTEWLKAHTDTDTAKKIAEGISVLNQGTPFTLDCDYDERKATVVNESAGHYYPENIKQFNYQINPAAKNRFNIPLQEYYNKSFLDIVVETRFAQPTGNFSEKVMQAVQFYTPFILVAPPNSLKALKEQGFKTFDSWWDESYDSIEDHYERFCAIEKIIEQISNTPIEQLKKSYAEMQGILEHNFEKMIEISKFGEIRPCSDFDHNQHTQQFSNLEEFT